MSRKNEKKLTPQQKKRQLEKDRAKRLANSPEKIRSLWLTLFRQATRFASRKYSRICWGNIPGLDTEDPFYLTGMEFLLIWYPTEADHSNYLNGSPVSSFVIESYQGAYPTEHGYTIHEYEVSLLQLVASDSEYGQLLAKQDKRGLLSEQGDVIERNLRILLAIGPVAQKSRRYYIDNQVEPIDNSLLTAVQPYLRRVEGDGLLPGQPFDQGLAESQLSDLEVDRLWELTAWISAWLYGPKENAQARHDRKKELQTLIECQKIRLSELKLELTQREDELSKIRNEMSVSTARLQDKEQSYEARKRQLDLELVEARARHSHAASEVSRLAGVFREKFRYVTQAIRTYGPVSQECRDAQLIGEQAKKQHEQAITKASQAKQNLELLAANYDASLLRLKREFASEHVIPLTQVNELEAKCAEIQSSLTQITSEQEQLSAELAKAEGIYGIYTSL